MTVVAERQNMMNKVTFSRFCFKYPAAYFKPLEPLEPNVQYVLCVTKV